MLFPGESLFSVEASARSADLLWSSDMQDMGSISVEPWLERPVHLLSLAFLDTLKTFIMYPPAFAHLNFIIKLDSFFKKVDTFVSNNNVFGYLSCSSSSITGLFSGMCTLVIFRGLIMPHRWSLQMYSWWVRRERENALPPSLFLVPPSAWFLGSPAVVFACSWLCIIFYCLFWSPQPVPAKFLFFFLTSNIS